MIILVLVLGGLIFGSFINALVWRLHEQEKMHHPKTKLTPTQYADLSIINGRSMCSHCRHPLAVRDLIPVLSWLRLGGKCRYCHHKIDDSPYIELLTAGLWVFSYIYWPNSFHGRGLFEFGLWLVFLVGLTALLVYDLRWFILPNRIVYPLIGLAMLQLFAGAILYDSGWSSLIGALWGVVVLGGLFYGLFQISKGRWIGGGDVKLGALLGLLVGGPLMTILLLFLASLSGTIVALPLLLTGRALRTTHLPFGPFLIVAAIIVRLFGSSLVAWYKLHYIVF